MDCFEHLPKATDSNFRQKFCKLIHILFFNQYPLLHWKLISFIDRIGKCCPERIISLILVFHINIIEYLLKKKKKGPKLQTKLKVETNSESLFQYQGGCFWPVQEVGNGVLNMYDFDPNAFQLFILTAEKF